MVIDMVGDRENMGFSMRQEALKNEIHDGTTHTFISVAPDQKIH